MDPVKNQIQVYHQDVTLEQNPTALAGRVSRAPSGIKELPTTFKIEQHANKIFADSNKLISLVHNRKTNFNLETSAWEMNFGLLYSCYKRTADPITKANIAFLIINYLDKAASFNTKPEQALKLESELVNNYEESLQLGIKAGDNLYHRITGNSSTSINNVGLTEKIIAAIKPTDVFALDNISVDELFPVSFNVAPDIADTNKSHNFFVNRFMHNMIRSSESTSPKLCLIDITKQIGESAITDKSKLPDIQSFEDKIQSSKKGIKDILKTSAKVIKENYNHLAPIIKAMSEDQVYDYLLSTTIVVSRAEINKDLAVLLTYPDLFSQADFKETPSTNYANRSKAIKSAITSWISSTGAGIGALNQRKMIANAAEDISEIEKETRFRATEYTVSGKTDTFYYSTKKTFLNTNIFKKFQALGNNPSRDSIAQSNLANGTEKIINTLLTSISEDKWEAMQADPIKRELIQTALFRIGQHLATGIQSYSDFRLFSQAIDRIHAEVTTLLLFFEPFNKINFQIDYKKYINAMMPELVKPQLVGIAKTAMTVFASVNAAVLSNNPQAVCAFGDYSYYESENLVGNRKTLAQILNDPKVGPVSLYTSEFHHNIVVGTNYSHYQKGTVIQDIKKIFKLKPKTHSLTVALDATIDFTNSKDVKKLLKTFQKEIRDGRINFVIYRSGQKFDMLGLDNYYGGPYYVINNGTEKWAKFNSLDQSKALKTDPLSEQFFALTAKAGPKIIDNYKQLIFSNTRDILDHIPKNLRADRSNVCVATAARNVHSPFIDIEVRFLDQKENEEMRIWIYSKFAEMFIKKNKLYYERQSFGFAHPNICVIANKIRINPGLDPNENKLYYNFFKEIEAKALESALD